MKENKKELNDDWDFLEAEKIIREQKKKQQITQSKKSYGLLFE